MEAKHTPGPWFSQDGFLTIYSMSEGDSGLTCAIAKVIREHTGTEEAEANARLIASAPTLLAVLDKAEGFVDRHSEDWYRSGQELLAEIRSAIASATGA